MKTEPTLILRLTLGLAVVLLAGFSALPLVPPRAVPADAPATRFSAGRAMADLQEIARAPHGAGSPAQAHVRDYIVAQAAALGLKAEIEASGEIENILVRLPGADPTLQVLVTGHYDSHPPAPGAGDDGLSVVAMLETMRVLHASPPLRNKIVFLFTDGEELGWLGAVAFLRDHPLAKQEIGVVLCFDGRPGNAALSLRQTSPGDAWLVRELSGSGLVLLSGSWTNRQERTDRDTDFETFQAAGFTGVEIENLERGTRYHTDRDTVEAISPALLQSYGQAMLPLATHFGSLDLRTRAKGPDVTYFSLPLGGLLVYPAWLMPLLSGLGLLALLAFMVIGWQRQSFSPRRFLWSLLGVLLGFLLLVFCAHLLWGGIQKGHPSSGFESSDAWLAWMMVVAAILLTAFLAILSRRLGPVNLAVAAVGIYMLVWSAVSLLMDADNPLTTAYIAWPFLGSVLGIGVLLFTKDPVWKALLLTLSALLVLVLMVPQLILATYTREDAWIPLLALAISVGLLSPQFGFIFGQSSSKEGGVQ